MSTLRLAWRAPQDRWLLCIGLALVATVLTYWPGGLGWLRYERAALAGGQYWRAVSAHLVHLNGTHLLLNLAGLFLLCELLWNELPLRHGLGMLAAGALTASALLFLLHPELLWYAGLSGALHGLWAGCALDGLWPQGVRRPPFATMPTSTWRRLQADWPLARCLCLAALLLLTIKLALESWLGAPVHVAQAIGAPVVTPAHLYGVLGGAAYLLAWRLARPG
jgi:rhomboid family GlyGly-CTERM serine protease